MSFSNMIRIKQLESNITEYAQKYYTDGSSPVSDEEFDALVDELRKLAPTSHVLKSVGWGYDTNDDTTKGKRLPHIYGPILGLPKCHDVKEVGVNFISDPLYASLKLDGISIVLYYRVGRLHVALTRGGSDGLTGIDVTDKVLKINPELASLKDDSFTGAIRGEIVMSFDNFEKFQATHESETIKVKNARNSTAGLINANEISEDLKYLTIVVYTVVGDNSYQTMSDEFTLISYHPNVISMPNMVAWLKDNFEHVAPYRRISVRSSDFVDCMTELKDEWYGVYPADGIVLTREVSVNAITGQVKYDAKAFKFPAECKHTEVLDVEWSLSKTRYLIPRVKLATVELSGTSVNYATGYNAKFIAENRISPGAIVEVRKSGEIIPQITRVIQYGETHLPVVCPCCGTQLVWSGVQLECPNTSCGNAATQDLLVWLQNLVPIDGLGDSIKLKFISGMFKPEATIEDVMNGKDVYNVRMVADSGHKKLICEMFNKLYGHEAYVFSLKSSLMALNIPRLGEITADKLSKYPQRVKTLVDSDSDIFGKWFDILIDIVGEATTNSIYANKDKFMRLKLIEDRIDWTESATVESKGKVAITGKLSVKRADFESELKTAGYSVGDISKDTKFLITDDPNSSSSKNTKADKLGITKITEADFRMNYLR